MATEPRASAASGEAAPWRFGDGRELRVDVPAKPSRDWRQGFEAGLAALAAVLGRREALLVNGARVFTLAQHHVDEALAAARAMAAPPRAPGDA